MSEELKPSKGNDFLLFQAQTGSTQVISPNARLSAAVGGASPGFGSGSGVFTSVARPSQKTSQSQSAPETSPDGRMGSFVMPRTPTPLLASAGASGSSLAALTSQYSALSQVRSSAVLLVCLLSLHSIPPLKSNLIAAQKESYFYLSL